MKNLLTNFFALTSIILLFQWQSGFSQVGNEFPIEVGPDSCFALGYANDDTKYMIVMRREKSYGADIVVQFHSKADHSLIGSPIVLGSTNMTFENFEKSIPQVAFDGTRYLIVWTDGKNGGIKYRFIHSQTFELSQLYNNPTLPIYLGGIKSLHYNPTTNKYLLVGSIETQGGSLYHIYTFIGTDGVLYSSSQLASFAVRRELSVSYANGKYLVCFIKKSSNPNLNDYEVVGQLLDENGNLVGSSFAIDTSLAPSDDPLFVLFDGKYHVCFYTEEEQTGWKIYAKRIDPNGNVSSSRSLISSDGHILPFAILGNSKILVTWTRFPYETTVGAIKGKFINLNLDPIGDDFLIFQHLNNKIPVGSMGVFADNKFFVYTTRLELATILTNGDVYGVTILDPTGVEDEINSVQTYELYQNFPNPFNSSTRIKFSVKETQNVSIRLMNILGEEIATLLNENVSSGVHSIEFNAEKFNLSGGVYFYQMKAGDFISTKKMIYLK